MIKLHPIDPLFDASREDLENRLIERLRARVVRFRDAAAFDAEGWAGLPPPRFEAGLKQPIGWNAGALVLDAEAATLSAILLHRRLVETGATHLGAYDERGWQLLPLALAVARLAGRPVKGFTHRHRDGKGARLEGERPGHDARVLVAAVVIDADLLVERASAHIAEAGAKPCGIVPALDVRPAAQGTQPLLAASRVLTRDRVAASRTTPPSLTVTGRP